MLRLAKLEAQTTARKERHRDGHFHDDEEPLVALLPERVRAGASTHPQVRGYVDCTPMQRWHQAEQ